MMNPESLCTFGLAELGAFELLIREWPRLCLTDCIYKLLQNPPMVFFLSFFPLSFSEIRLKDK